MVIIFIKGRLSITADKIYKLRFKRRLFKIVPYYKSMEANHPQVVANFDHRGMVGRHLYIAYTYFDYCNV